MSRVIAGLDANLTMDLKETTASMPKSSRTLRVMLAAMAVAGLLLAMAAVPSQADAAVSWNTRAYWAPTVLQPGERGGVLLYMGNVGDEPALGWPTVEVTLPEGVTFSGSNTTAPFWQCTTGADLQVVTCVSPLGNSLPFVWPPAYSKVGAGFSDAPIQIAVDVAADAPTGIHQLSVALSGAGAAEPTIWTADVRTGGPPAGFGVIEGTFEAGARSGDGSAFTQAGGHPDRFVTSFVTTKKFNDPAETGLWSTLVEPVSGTKDAIVDLPPGLVGDPGAVPLCTIAHVNTESCPPSTQVGVAEVANIAGPDKQLYGIYNVEPSKDAPAQFAFFTDGGPVVLTPRVRSDGDWGLSVDTKDITEANPLFGATVTMWGNPADPANDDQRCAKPNSVAFACVGFDSNNSTNQQPVELYSASPSSVLPRPFLSNPTRCDGTPEITSMHLSPWKSPARFEADGDPDLTDPLWESYSASAPPLTGCDRLSFIPSIDVTPTRSTPGGAAGLEFKLSIPQNDAPNGLATAHLRNAKVTLPAGTTVNSGSAEGLASCGSGQIGLVSRSPVRFTKVEPSCPLASKVGSVVVDTPLLDEPMTGDVFLAAEGDHPYDSLVAMYMVLRGPGILGKLAGEVDLDPRTGQITTTVLDNPQLPFDTLTVNLKPGERAPLTLPSACGTHVTSAQFVSWAGHDVTVTDDGFTVACPGNAGLFDPGFSAGTVDPVAGASSPLRMRVTRDAGKDLGRIVTTMPKGLLAAPKSVGVCSEAQLASSSGKAGRTVQGAASCPASSQIGTTTVGVGSGASPFYPLIPGTGSTGRVFLTGAHHNTDAPQPGRRQIAYGVGIEVPAVAGPFDLGTVLVRAAIYADPTTAELTVVSDKLPHILQGVPLNTRDIRVDIDRAGFSRNPTSCKEQQFAADISAQDGTTVQRSSRFQVGECAALAFKPKLALRLTGKRQRKTGGHPGVRAVVTQKRGEAGIRKAAVQLPSSVALDPDNAQALCEYADGIKAEPTCPKGSIVGRAKAVSPLLKKPLSGNVYFVKNQRRSKSGNVIRTLPMIVLALRGEIAVNLRGTSSVKAGRLVNTFANVPDAPISKFNLNIKGGSSGILVVTKRQSGSRINLCSARQVAGVNMNGHNGKRTDTNIGVRTPCGKRKGTAKRRARR